MQAGRIFLRHRTTGAVYSTEDGEHYRNHSTGAEGTASPEQISATFVIPLALNAAAEQNPNIIKLIEALSLHIEQ